MEKKPQDTESRHADKFIVRFPDGMRDRLKEAAAASQRTMNAEIVARLQSSFEQPSSNDGAEWRLKLRLHENETRMDTTASHLRVAQMHGELLAQRLREVDEKTSAADRHKLAADLADAIDEAERLEQRQKVLVAENAALERERDALYKQELQRLDAAVEPVVQDAYRELHESEATKGIPEELRQIKVLPAAKRASKKAGK